MWAEHILYTIAIAIFVSMILQHYKIHDISWILVPMSAVPDVDYPVSRLMTFIGLKYPYIWNHGDFHNLIGLIVLSSIIALYLYRKKIGNFLLIWIMCVSGFALHLLEDMFVYDHIYSVLYPITIKVYGWNIVPESGSLIIGGQGVFTVGLALLAIIILIRVAFTGDDWITGYQKDYHNWMKYFTFHPYSLTMKTYMIILLNQANTYKYPEE